MLWPSERLKQERDRDIGESIEGEREVRGIERQADVEGKRRRVVTPQV